MNRYRQYGRLDDVPQIVGDAAFLRLDMDRDPATLAPGVAQRIENMRVEEGGLTVRGGIARQFEAATSIGTIYHCGVYCPLGGEDQLVLITRDRLCLFTPDSRKLTAYNFPDGELVEKGDAVDTVQGNVGAGTLARMFVFRGWSKTVLEFTGTAVVVNPDVPPAEFGLFYQNRLAVNSDSQSVKISDFLDFGAGHWSLLNQFQIERGGADYLVSMLPYQKDYVLIGARKKIFMAFFDPNLDATGYTGGLTNKSWLRFLTTEAGPTGREAMLEAAGLVWFVSDSGIYALQPQLDNQLTPLGQPLSADIQPVFKNLAAEFVSSACIQRFGYRLYFALPISAEPQPIANLTVTNTVTVGVELPVNLPVNLASGGLAEVTSFTPHNLAVGDYVQISGIATGGVNGRRLVSATPDDYTFLFALENATGVLLGGRGTFQKLATRNNVIAVFNLKQRSAETPLGAWESVDTLPEGIYADWLRLANFGGQQRLWLVDAVSGPALYEEGTVDEIGDIIGGVQLPVKLPVELTAANFANAPIPGRLLSRVYRWDGGRDSFAYLRRLRSAETRLTAASGENGQVTVRVKTPNRPDQEFTRTFTGTDTQPDVAVNQRLFQRGLEAELEVKIASGRPVVRSLELQTLQTGEH